MFVLLFFGGFAVAGATVARQDVVVVEPGEEVVIRLRGYDPTGREQEARVTSLPASGVLRHLSKVFATHGYDPKAGTLIEVGDVISGNRLLYTAPAVGGFWGEFSFTMGTEAVVTLVAPTFDLVTATFETSTEGWTVDRNGEKKLTHDKTSFGAVNRFIAASDGLIAADGGGVELNSSRWSFVAPAAFHGNHLAAYGGRLEFTLGALAGDFSHFSPRHNLVELLCDHCGHHNNSILLVYPLEPFSLFQGSITMSFSIPLTPSFWLRDPENVLFPWRPPTTCDLAAVLRDISALRILGDLTDWYETIALDDVRLRASPPGPGGALLICAQLPVCAC